MPTERHRTTIYAGRAGRIPPPGGADLSSRIDHNKTEQALRASEERFKRYFELGLIGMAITSPSKGCVEVNDELCRMLGYERDELTQKTWAEMTHPEDLSGDVEQFNRVMAFDSLATPIPSAQGVAR